MDALVESSPGPSAGGAIWRALDRLDALLERAVSAAQVAYGPAAAGDPCGGRPGLLLRARFAVEAASTGEQP